MRIVMLSLILVGVVSVVVSAEESVYIVHHGDGTSTTYRQHYNVVGNSIVYGERVRVVEQFATSIDRPVNFSVDASRINVQPVDRETHQQTMDYHRTGLQTEQVRNNINLDNRNMTLREDVTYHRMGLDDRQMTIREQESFVRRVDSVSRTFGWDARSRQNKERDRERAAEHQRDDQRQTFQTVSNELQEWSRLRNDRRH